MLTQNFWKYGFYIHLSIVLIIAMSAYLGILPTQYRFIPRFDLIGHAVLIGLLAFFLDGLLRFRPLFPGKLPVLRLAPVLVLVITAIEECAQVLSPRRSASFSDFTADVIGVIWFVWLAKKLDALSRKDPKAQDEEFQTITRQQ